MTRFSSTHHFIPPRFGLYEFDDQDISSGDQPVRRWFSHFDGLLGHPAQAVNLGWSHGAAVALVRTSGVGHSGDFDTRLNALHLALGGTTLPLVNRPLDAASTFREIERLSAIDEAWSPSDQFISVTTPQYIAGYQLLDVGVVFFAATPPRPPRIRPVEDWTVYNIDATKEFPLSALYHN